MNFMTFPSFLKLLDAGRGRHDGTPLPGIYQELIAIT
jgi:hypothetical protein